MRWIQWTCCAGVFAAVVMAGVHPASAEVILTDNFNDNNLNANPDWSLAGEAGSPGYLTGSPTNSGGVLAGGLANMALSVTDPNATGAVTINFRMRLNSDNQGKKEFAVYLGQIDGVGIGFEGAIQTNASVQFFEGQIIQSTDGGVTDTDLSGNKRELRDVGTDYVDFQFIWNRVTGEIEMTADPGDGVVNLGSYINTNTAYNSFNNAVLYWNSGVIEVDNVSVDVTPTPEPGSLAVSLLGMAMLLTRNRRAAE